MKNHRRGGVKNNRKGFTLVELLVAMGIFTIVISIATGGFISSLRTQRQVASLISAQSNASLVLEQMAREIRTGFLFCHAPGSTSPNSNCDSPPGGGGNNPTLCTIDIDSGYPGGGNSYPALYNLPDGDLPAWNCPSLDYFNAQGADVNYSLQGGQLIKSDPTVNNGAPESITGDSVTVKYLHFILFGNLEGDTWTPRVTIVLGVVPSSTDPAVNSDVLNLQTTVSARTIDCYTNSSGSSQC